MTQPGPSATPARPANSRRRGGVAPRLCLGLVMVAYLALACCYALLTPVDNAPDETAHRVYVQWLAENRRLPVFDPADAQHYELHQPPL